MSVSAPGNTREVSGQEHAAGPASFFSPKAVVLIGPPGSGKGTQAEKLASLYGVPHITTGGMLREEVAKQTLLGKKFQQIMAHGDFLPDKDMLALVQSRLSQPDAAAGFILDGFPRTLAQAKMLCDIPEGDRIDAAIALICSEEDIIKRLQGRLVCPTCGHGYHDVSDPPKVSMVCDADGTTLSRRADDTREIILHRIAVYNDLTAPLIDFYRQVGILRIMDASCPADAVLKNVILAVESVRPV